MEENSPSSIEEVSQADWEKTPESVKRLVRSLIGRIKQLERQYEELKAENQLDISTIETFCGKRV